MSTTGATFPNSPTTGMTTEVVLPGIVEPEGLQIRTRELAAPGPGQVRVAVEATGVSFAEQQMLRGKYYDQPPFPFVPGYDLVGTVTAVGPDGDESMIGSRYAAVTKVGAWASDVVLDADDLVEVPDGVDPAAAATLLINGATAYRMLYLVAEARPGQTILVLGANGGVGNTLVQLARRDGIRVIGTASPATMTPCAPSAPSLSTTATPTCPHACASSPRTASTPSSTTSVAPASSTPTGCWAAAAPWSPTARRRRRTTPARRRSRS
jgi:hypothetical protein